VTEVTSADESGDRAIALRRDSVAAALEWKLRYGARCGLTYVSKTARCGRMSVRYLFPGKAMFEGPTGFRSGGAGGRAWKLGTIPGQFLRPAKNGHHDGRRVTQRRI
jgi:hypothetical protein